MLLSFSQKSTITGRVTDSSGMPLAGVTVTVKGSRSGTVTDQGGNYSIEIKQGDDFLQFGMIGFVTITERIKNRTIINVIMREEKVSLDEVVVVGYGSGKQKSSWIRAEAAPAYSMISDGGFSRYNRAFNTEGYASTTENGFRSVISNPLSTFSIDVDNASWSNIRRFINNGSLPPPEPVWPP